jgi:DNA helicase-2/ATP-dependent DNA helicase PcrA
LEDPDQLEEERRLMYVGVTRAKDRLYLVRAFRRTLYGRSEMNPPSRFLLDVPAVGPAGERSTGPARLSNHQAVQDATRWVSERSAGARPAPGGGRSGSGRSGPAGQQPSAGADDDDTRKPQFRPGERVDHGLFGQGIVLKTQLTADDEEVTVAFQGQGTKTLLASFARLRKIG